MAILQKKINLPVISIVIGTFNRPATINLLLKQLILESKKINFEVIVYDQSDKKNYQKLSAIFPKNTCFKLIRLDHPNTCQYLNLGWKNARGAIVLYLDDDVQITKETIPAHINAYTNQKTMAVAGRVINAKEKINHSDRIGRVYFFGAIIEKNFSSEKKAFVDFPYGCNMSFRKSILEKIDGFDEKLAPPIYSFNEVDLGIRVSKKWPNSIIFEPKALVYHKRYASGGTRSYKQSEIKASTDFNYGYFLGKNFSLAENLLCLLRRIFFQLANDPKAIPHILKGFFYAKQV